MTHEERVAEFNRRVNKKAYNRGEALLRERLSDITTEAEYEEAIENLTWSAYYNDGGSFKYGSLSVEECYFLVVENMGYDEADELLRDYEYDVA